MKTHALWLVVVGVAVACSRGGDTTGPSGSRVASAPEAFRGGPSFNTHLRGDEVVPPVATNGTGEAILYVGKGASRVGFKLLLAGLENVTAAHIHCGLEGVNGPAVAALYEGPPVSPRGTLAVGTVSDANLIARPASPVCPGGVADAAAMIAKMRSGHAYVSVRTLAHPGGEIRGQIR